MLYTSLPQLVGHTPLMQLGSLMAREQLPATILAKLEFLNPAGSVKDRVALAMLQAAEQTGLLRPGGTVIEPTSGNTGIGLACLAVPRGYRCIIVMPDSMSMERRQLMAAYGAQVELTPGTLGMQGAIDRANALHAQIPNSWIPGQFDNPANPQAHYDTTGPELWADAQGQIDVFVAGVGTGGTLTGVGRYLKEQDPNIRIVAVEPADSPLLSRGIAGPHGLQGIGANFVPQVLDTTVYDRIFPVAQQDAEAATRLVAQTEGLLVGISSGAALHAAMTLAREPALAGKTIAVLFPDTGTRYLSSPVFQ